MQSKAVPELVMYVITENPKDYPGHFVVRRHVIGNWNVIPDRTPVGVKKTLEDARRLVPEGLARFVPSPGDDPVIKESWL